MKWGQALRRKGVYVSIIMVVIGVFMSISAYCEKSGLAKAHPALASADRTHASLVDRQLDAVEHGALKEGEQSVEQMMVLRIRYGRAGMSVTAGIVIALLGVVFAGVFLHKEAQLQAAIDETETPERPPASPAA